MTQNEYSQKPTEPAILPKPWEDSTVEIVRPILWLGKIKRWKAECLGYILWWVPAIVLIAFHPGVETDHAFMVGVTWIIASVYSGILTRINFDIDDEKKEIKP